MALIWKGLILDYALTQDPIARLSVPEENETMEINFAFVWLSYKKSNLWFSSSELFLFYCFANVNLMVFFQIILWLLPLSLCLWNFKIRVKRLQMGWLDLSFFY